MKSNMSSAGLIAALALAFPTLANASTQSFSTTISGFFHDYTYTNTDPADSNIYLDDVNIAGLNQFNPAWGTLNSINVHLTASLDVSADLTGGDATNSANPAMVEVFGLLDHSFDLVVWDSASGGGQSASMGFPDVFNTDSLSCMDSGCWDGQIDIVDLDHAADITGIANLNDFIGTGLIDPGTLTFGVAYPGSLDFILTDMSDASVDVFITDPFDNIGVTVTYDYSAVPLPPALWLFGSALAGLGLVRRRRQNIAS